MKFPVARLDDQIRGTLPYVIAIVGNETFLRREALAQLLERIHGGAPAPEDVSHRGSAGASPADELAELFDDLRTPSLFGGAHSVVLEDAERYLNADPEAWQRWLVHPGAGGHLLLLLDRLDGRTRVARALAKHGWWIEVARPFHRPPPWKPSARPWEHDLNRWLVARARRVGLRIDAPTAHVLQTRVGNDLGELAFAVDRLRTALGDGAQVTEEAVLDHTRSGEESDLFELVDAMFSGQRQRSLELVGHLLTRGTTDRSGARITDPSTLLLQFTGAALSRLRQLRTAHRVRDAGGNETDLLRETGVARPFLPRLELQVRATTPEGLGRLVNELYRADADLKRGRGPRPEELLERLVLC